uniref:Transmembrane protein 240 n=1 Tax=Eptatretus burgeri TaxID=7764 RepID=A0A8C4R5E9_EPTBU
MYILWSDMTRHGMIVGVCVWCVCGVCVRAHPRHHVHYVLPYGGEEAKATAPDGYAVTPALSKQEVDLLLGLVLGLTASWFLLWLDRCLADIDVRQIYGRTGRAHDFCGPREAAISWAGMER